MIMTEASVFPFMSGGGEMGKLMREKDWQSSGVGEPSGWPQSLRTSLYIVLNAKFPMFLWWGEQLICFYNDAYRPSLGQHGKHPGILGMNHNGTIRATSRPGQGATFDIFIPTNLAVHL